MRRGPGALALLAALLGSARPAAAALHVLVVAGLGGETGYEERFTSDAEAIARASRSLAGDPARVVLLTGSAATAEAIQAQLRGLRKRMRASDDLMLVLVGHGSFDGEQYRFNVPGRDLSAKSLGAALDAVPARRQLIVNTSSASGALLEPLRRKGRVVISATRSGAEQSATQFARYWAQSLASSAADLDKDGWITAAEAFDFTSRQVQDHYKRDVSLATEHPELEGERASSFRVARIVAGEESVSSADPASDPRVARRDALVRAVESLRERKSAMERDDYLRELERALVELAQLEDEIEGIAPRGQAR
jgi:hypothetical protein